MKLWQRVRDPIIIALMLAALGGLWQTYQQAQKVPGLTNQIKALRNEVRAQNEKLSDLKTAVAVLDARSQQHGSYVPVQ